MVSRLIGGYRHLIRVISRRTMNFASANVWYNTRWIFEYDHRRFGMTHAIFGVDRKRMLLSAVYLTCALPRLT